jgi:hypothetical protein
MIRRQFEKDMLDPLSEASTRPAMRRDRQTPTAVFAAGVISHHWRFRENSIPITGKMPDIAQLDKAATRSRS